METPASHAFAQPPPVAEQPQTPDDAPRAAAEHRWGYRLALVGVLAVALGLRLWGIGQGLPFAYNSDESAHFVPYAIGMYSYGLNPQNYFANPPALTYLLHVVFGVWFGGRAGVSHEFALYPGHVYVVARVTVALLGTISVLLLYLTGARLFDRRVGLLAAALMSVAFLPVFYSHLALNDVPTLAPLTLSLWGTAGVLRYGRLRDYVIAGVGLGLGCATKYTAGIVIVPLFAAACIQFLQPQGERRALVGVSAAALCAAIFFFIANPYSVLDFSAFKNGISHQSSVSEDGSGKLGAPRDGGLAYYAWTLTWGLGWLPSSAAAGGTVMLWWGRRMLLWLFVPTLALFFLFMGTQGRYFGRWLLPIFPLMCMLAAFFVVENARRVELRHRVAGIAVAALGATVLLAQGLVYSVHSGLVLSRADTRTEVRDWMVANIPIGTRVVVEPVVPDTWVQDPGHPTPLTSNGNRWLKYPSLRSVINPQGAVDLADSHVVSSLEDYERTLAPALIPYYEHLRYCYVVSGFDQSGRSVADPKQVPLAVAYYKALAKQATVAYRVTPYSPGKGPVGFSFDWTFDYYPLAYDRPGPTMTVYHLSGGSCAPAAPHAAHSQRAAGPRTHSKAARSHG